LTTQSIEDPSALPADAGSAPAAAARPGLAGKSAYLLLALCVLGLDQVTKGLVEARLAVHASWQVIPGFMNLTHVRNSGVAFGLFATAGDGVSRVVVLSLLGLLALVVVGLYFWRTPLADRLLLTSLGLILGGAVGNLVDRLGSGSVTDFIDVYVGTYHWHTFNVADSAITVGIALMALDLLRTSTSRAASRAEA
jgi:signal peptidase II